MNNDSKIPPHIPKEALKFPTKIPPLDQSSPRTYWWLLGSIIAILVCILIILIVWIYLVSLSATPSWLPAWLPGAEQTLPDLPPVNVPAVAVPHTCPTTPVSFADHVNCLEIIELEPYFAEIEALF